MKSLSDGARLILDSAKIAEALADYPFIGITFNEDTHSTSGEAGFENIICDTLSNKMLWGYRVTLFTREYEAAVLLDKAVLCVHINFFFNGFNSSGEASNLFHLETEIADIQEWIAETVVTWGKENV